MKQNRVKQRIREGKLALGTYLTIAETALVELIGLAGFDAAWIDLEHAMFDLSTLENMIRAAEVVGITTIFRLPEEDWKTILLLLDAGAGAIQLPHVSNAATAKRAVDAVRYPPLGERGASSSGRAARYGTVDYAEHVRTSNEEVLLIVMIEDQEGLDNLEEIAAVEGVDIVTIGPADLASALRVSEPNSPRMHEVAEDIARRVKAVGNAKLSISLGHPSLTLTAADAVRLGICYSNVGPNPARRLLHSYTTQLTKLRAELAELEQ